MQNITKMDYPGCVGFWVRFYQSRRLIAGKFFGKEKCGGWTEALKLAKAWRNEAKTEIEKVLGPRRKHPPCYTVLFRNNKSGVTGVNFALNNIRGRECPCWVVTWRAKPYVAKTKRFYFHHHRGGTKEQSAAARQLAVEFRREIEKKLLKKSA